MGLLTTLIPPPWSLVARIGIYALIIVAFSGTCFYKGVEFEHTRWDADNARIAAENGKEVERVEKIVNKETVRYVTRTQAIPARIEAVARVVTPADDAACVLPPGFVSMWNRVNAASTPPPGAGGVHAAADPTVGDDAGAGGADAEAVGHRAPAPPRSGDVRAH